MFHLHKHYPKCEAILMWLRNNKLVGEKFLLWIRNEHKNSPLQAFSYILGKIAKENQNIKIIHGRDFIS